MAIVTAALLAVALAGCGVGPATTQEKISKTAMTYLKALAAGDTATACAQLTPRGHGAGCAPAMKQRLSRLDTRALSTAADAAMDIKVHGNAATAALARPHVARLVLARVGGQWRIDSGYTVPPAAITRHSAGVIAGGGRLVDIGGDRRLYLKCVGSGGPTVMLEAGLGGSSDSWRDVQPQLGLATRTCAYDRAGLGNSVALPGVHDACDEIGDLQRLLHAAHIPPPYVLVGHSYGPWLATAQICPFSVRRGSAPADPRSAGAWALDRVLDAADPCPSTRRSCVLEAVDPAYHRSQAGVCRGSSETPTRRAKRNPSATPVARCVGAATSPEMAAASAGRVWRRSLNASSASRSRAWLALTSAHTVGRRSRQRDTEQRFGPGVRGFV